MPNNKNNGNALDLLELTRFDESVQRSVYSIVIGHNDPDKAALLLVRLNRERLLQGPLAHAIIRGIGTTPVLSQFEIAILNLERYFQATGRSIATVTTDIEGNCKILLNYLATHPNPIDFLNVSILLAKISLSKTTLLKGEYPTKRHRVQADMAALCSPAFPAIVFQKCLIAGLLTGRSAEVTYGLILECAPIWYNQAEIPSLFVRYPLEQFTAELFAELVEVTKISIREGSDLNRVRAVLSRAMLIPDVTAVERPSNYGRSSSALYKDQRVDVCDSDRQERAAVSPYG